MLSRANLVPKLNTTNENCSVPLQVIFSQATAVWVLIKYAPCDRLEIVSHVARCCDLIRIWKIITNWV